MNAHFFLLVGDDTPIYSPLGFRIPTHKSSHMHLLTGQLSSELENGASGEYRDSVMSGFFAEKMKERRSNKR